MRLEPIPASRGLILDRNGTRAGRQPAGLPARADPRAGAGPRRHAAAACVELELLDAGRPRRRSRRIDPLAPRLRQRADPAAPDRRGDRRASPCIATSSRAWTCARARRATIRYGELAVHALGYVGAISEEDLEAIDRAALRRHLADRQARRRAAPTKTQLHGRNGYQQILVNAQGRSVQAPGRATSRTCRPGTASPGTDLMLSLDLPRSRPPRQALGERRGAVVAHRSAQRRRAGARQPPGLRPERCSAAASRAANTRTLTDNIDKPLFNRALRGAYPPGSTIKPVMALAGLTYGVVDPRRHAVLHRRLPPARQQPPCTARARAACTARWTCATPSRDPATCISTGWPRSSASTASPSFLAPFGFGAAHRHRHRRREARPAAVAGMEEAALQATRGPGLVPGRDRQLRHRPGLPAGHAAAAGAHDGDAGRRAASSFQPRLVTGMRDPAPARSTQLDPVPLPRRRAASAPSNWDVGHGGHDRRHDLRHGARPSARTRSYKIAGKTGTAQVFTVGAERKYDAKTVAERLRDHAWFIAFAPAEAPRIAVACWWRTAASAPAPPRPIARQVMDAYLLPRLPSRRRSRRSDAGARG